MIHLNHYEYCHEAVQDYLLQADQNARSLQEYIARERITEDELTEWLNNYTTLLNVWFCELLYYPIRTNSNRWIRILEDKLQTEKYLSIPEIINLFDIATLRYNGQLEGVDELKPHLSAYMVIRKYCKSSDFRIETIAGQRMNLTLKKFNDIRRNIKKLLTENLKNRYPFNETIQPFEQAYLDSYLNIVTEEENRESAIINLMMQFDREIARPLFVDYGYIE